MKNKAEGPSGHERTESQVGRDEKGRISFSSKGGGWHLPHMNKADPLPGGPHLATSELPTKTELDHLQWALGFPYHLVLTSALAVRMGGFDIFSKPSGDMFGGCRWLRKRLVLLNHWLPTLR